MRQLQEMASALGLSNSSDSAPNAGQTDLNSILAGLSGGQNPPQQESNSLPVSTAELMKISSLLQNVQQETPATSLLHALRPMLKPERRKKVDEAVKIIRLLSLLPILQQSGLLKGFLGEHNPHDD